MESTRSSPYTQESANTLLPEPEDFDQTTPIIFAYFPPTPKCIRF